ncbi:hypothetical protein KSS87_013424 [Heliosperma pusillum]|nr:hypothetical protein KSS87_013424 [Heliosperma pusillum]
MMGDDANVSDANTVKEQHKISLMRAYVESRDPASKDEDDLMLRRFLRARDLDVEKASSLFLKYLKWKKTFIPKGHISEDEVKYDVSQNKMFIGGLDKSGRPVTVVYGGRHFQNTKPGGLDEFKRFCAFTLEKIISRMPPGQEKFVSIADVKGWGYSNSDIRGYLGALSVLQVKAGTLVIDIIMPKGLRTLVKAEYDELNGLFVILQDCYPERLGKMYIVHAPKIFMTVWKMVYPFIDDNTKRKIVFVDSKQVKSTLLEDIEESQIPDVYGGKLPLTPIQDA